jgi:hypothetical protein
MKKQECKNPLIVYRSEIVIREDETGEQRVILWGMDYCSLADFNHRVKTNQIIIK